MKTLLVGIGAAGNKAVCTAIENGTIAVEDTVIINSTSKDFPAEYKGETIVLSVKDTGCGKERKIAKDYAMNAIKSGKLNLENISNYSTVIICTSVEGGTGSGSTPMIAKYFNQVHRKNVHIIAFIGFEDDPRGTGNTVEFGQEIDPALIVQTIRNSAFLKEVGGNKFKAEAAANEEMCRRLRILTGQKFINSKQNIDDTDILKVSNTAGYTTVEECFLEKPLVDKDDFNKIIKKMVYNTKSIQNKTPGAVRLGIILNIDPASEDAIDYTFKDLKTAYGNPYECFMQEQWDGKQEYIAYIVSGMPMPLDEMKETYARYKEQSAMVNKAPDSFFAEMAEFGIDSEDRRFDMIKPVESGLSTEEFMAQFETK